MKLKYKHAFAITVFIFLAFAPALVAASPVNNFVTAQDEDFNTIIDKLFTEGAEAMFANIDDTGVPIVIYGRIGIPTSIIDFSNPMFDNCLALGMVSTHGEILETILDMLGMNITQDMGGLSSLVPSDYVATQFGGSEQGMPNLIELLGSDANILLSLYLNLDQATSQQRMSQVLNTLSVSFGFQFAEVMLFRIDENTFPPEANVQLPFSSLDIYLYQITNPFADAVNAIRQVLGTGGFGDSIDTAKFIEARAAAAGLIAVPDMAYLIDFINTTFGGSSSSGFALAAENSIPSLLVSQFPVVEGPLSIGAIGYIGEQVVSSSSDSIGMATLVGATSDFTPLSGAISVVLMHVSSVANITSATPFAENYTLLDPTVGIVLWNATQFGTQSDYVVHFSSNEFPPLITIQRTFAPESTTVDGSTQVTVTVTNEGDAAITNVRLNDTGLLDYYPDLPLSGDTSKEVGTLNPGESISITYTVTFNNEGSYTFPKAEVSYEYNGNSYVKTTTRNGFVVTQQPTDVMSQIISDGWPYTGGVIGLIVLGGIWQVAKLAKGAREFEV